MAAAWSSYQSGKQVSSTAANRAKSAGHYQYLTSATTCNVLEATITTSTTSLTLVLLPLPLPTGPIATTNATSDVPTTATSVSSCHFHDHYYCFFISCPILLLPQVLAPATTMTCCFFKHNYDGFHLPALLLPLLSLLLQKLLTPYFVSIAASTVMR